MGPDEAIEINKAWKERRKKAKAVNFGYLFGMWWKKFILYARDNYDLNISEEEAQESREDFFNTFTYLERWHKRQKSFAKRNGYVRSLSGRKRRLPDAQRGDRSFECMEAERQSVNSPVQGFACDINLMVALELRREFPPPILFITGTVHDAILMLIKKGYEERVLTRASSICHHPDIFKKLKIKLKVPIEGDTSIGPWGNSLGLKKWLKQFA